MTEIKETNVHGESFDLVFRFTKGSDNVELFMDELVKLTLDGLLNDYGRILVRVNWFAKGLEVIAPDTLLNTDTPQHALQGTSEGSGSTEESNPSPNTT